MTRACLKVAGKMPVFREELTMCVTADLIVGKMVCRMRVGIGSRGHVVGFELRRSLETSSSVRGAKEQSEATVVGLS